MWYPLFFYFQDQQKQFNCKNHQIKFKYDLKDIIWLV